MYLIEHRNFDFCIQLGDLWGDMIPVIHYLSSFVGIISIFGLFATKKFKKKLYYIIPFIVWILFYLLQWIINNPSPYYPECKSPVISMNTVLPQSDSAYVSSVLIVIVIYNLTSPKSLAWKLTILAISSISILVVYVAFYFSFIASFTQLLVTFLLTIFVTFVLCLIFNHSIWGRMYIQIGCGNENDIL
jgi:hypothetical protein